MKFLKNSISEIYDQIINMFKYLYSRLIKKNEDNELTEILVTYNEIYRVEDPMFIA